MFIYIFVIYVICETFETKSGIPCFHFYVLSFKSPKYRSSSAMTSCDNAACWDPTSNTF